LSKDSYRGHNYPHRFRVLDLRPGAAHHQGDPARVEPVIGHLQGDYRMGRNYLKGYAGDRANAVLAAAGYNFRLLLCAGSSASCAPCFYSSRAPSKRLASLNPEPGSILHGRLNDLRSVIMRSFIFVAEAIRRVHVLQFLGIPNRQQFHYRA
jgi:hypothetical protein